jgi:peptidase M28-like protein
VVGGRGARTDRLDRLLEGLSQAERDRIAPYLNYDMVGSPNYIFMVNDADESTFPAPVPIPEGSVAIEDLYESYYTLIGEPYDDTEVSGRSDYQAFIEAGIPSGGLFTGAEEIKTPEQQAIWGGIAGEQFDPCYHEACDTLENYDPHALEVNSDLIAFAQLTFAYSTESVNGVPGKRVPGPPPRPAGAGGTRGQVRRGRRRPRAWRAGLVAQPYLSENAGGPCDRPRRLMGDDPAARSGNAAPRRPDAVGTRS